MSRLLALVLALCAILPTQVWAAACHEPDRCECRRSDTAAQDGPVARRFDCCATPCDAEVPQTAATPVRSERMAQATVVAWLPESAEPRVDALEVPRPHTRTRGPPRAVYDLVRHRLL